MGPFLDVNTTSPMKPHALGHWLWSYYLHSVSWDVVPGPTTSLISRSASEPHVGLGTTRREIKEEDEAGINNLFIVFSFHSLPVLQRSLVTTPRQPPLPQLPALLPLQLKPLTLPVQP